MIITEGGLQKQTTTVHRKWEVHSDQTVSPMNDTYNVGWRKNIKIAHYLLPPVIFVSNKIC